MHICRIVCLLLCTVSFAPVFAQTYPSKPVRIISPFPAGGPADAMLRPLAQKMSESLKVQCIVDNRPGANGIIGTELAVRAAPDGYTLVLGSTSSLPMNAAIYPKLPFDPIRDLAPIGAFGYSVQILTVHPSLPAATVKEFIALARARPGEISVASPGIGSAPHFALEMFSAMTGTRLLHVPYKGGGPALAEQLAGQVMAYFGSMQAAMPQIRAGRLRALGVAALQRSPAAPAIPTIAESGVLGFEVGGIFGLLAPAKTPREIILKLNAEIIRAAALPDFAGSLRAVGTDPLATTPEEFADIIRNDMPKWAKVAREANIRAE
jgi:tripartite-type tricarboxylate transporter receptor subunit TctC